MYQFEGEAPMFQNLDIFKMSHAMAVHAANRQSVVAQNLANADTPGYTALSVSSFQDIVQHQSSGSGMLATRPKHIGASSGMASSDLASDARSRSPNGNSVSLEEEMMKAVGIQRQHGRALAIYKSSLGILRTSLGRR